MTKKHKKLSRAEVLEAKILALQEYKTRCPASKRKTVKQLIYEYTRIWDDLTTNLKFSRI